MVKAVVKIGPSQYLVSKGDELIVTGVADGEKKLSLEPLLLIDEAKTSIGTPLVNGARVTAEIKQQMLGDKTTSIRYKAKKRVKKIRGARQKQSKIVITGITSAKAK